MRGQSNIYQPHSPNTYAEAKTKRRQPRRRTISPKSGKPIKLQNACATQGATICFDRVNKNTAYMPNIVV